MQIQQGSSSPGPRSFDKSEIAAWMLRQMAAELGVDPGSIDVRKPFSRYGMDSMTAVVLTGELEQWLGRPVPPDLLGQFASIKSLAEHLAQEAPPTETSAIQPPAEEPEDEPAAWERRAPSFFQRLVQGLTVRVVRVLMRIEVEGLERVPSSGPFILACNHLHIIDTPITFSVLRGPVVFFVSEHMLGFPLVGWFLGQLGQSIYVARGEGDRRALASALAVLRGGGTLAIAPEGRISRTGGLLQGQTGAAYLATRAGVPVLPVVAFGQENLGRHWRRLRRPAVMVRLGTPLNPPGTGVRTPQLEEFTEKIMLALARMLPEAYRGFYAGAVKEGSDFSSAPVSAAKPGDSGSTGGNG
jgi:1-acyl-sn-glycerol-3-phosphate acyltransferase